MPSRARTGEGGVRRRGSRRRSATARAPAHPRPATPRPAPPSGSSRGPRAPAGDCIGQPEQRRDAGAGRDAVRRRRPRPGPVESAAMTSSSAARTAGGQLGHRLPRPAAAHVLAAAPSRPAARGRGSAPRRSSAPCHSPTSISRSRGSRRTGIPAASATRSAVTRARARSDATTTLGLVARRACARPLLGLGQPDRRERDVLAALPDPAAALSASARAGQDDGAAVPRRSSRPGAHGARGLDAAGRSPGSPSRAARARSTRAPRRAGRGRRCRRSR